MKSTARRAITKMERAKTELQRAALEFENLNDPFRRKLIIICQDINNLQDSLKGDTR